jgi:2TM domain
MAGATSTEDRDEIVAGTPEELREQALRQLKKRRDLKAHAFVYLLVNLVVWGIWVAIGLTSPHSWWPWPVFVTLAWGIGLVTNAWDVYFRRPITEEEVQHEIEQLHGTGHRA